MAWPLAFASLLASAPAPSPLSWSGPASCPDQAEVRAELRRLLPDGDVPVPVSFRARVRRDGDRHVLELRSSDPATPSRSLQADDCWTLASSAALVIAIELDALQATAAVPTATDVESSSVPEPPVVPGPTLEDRPPRPVDPTSADDPPTTRPRPERDRRPRPVRGTVRVHGGGGSMGLPRIGPVAGGAVGLGIPRFSGELLAELQPRQQTTYPDDVAGAELRIVASAIRACPTLLPGPVEIPLCAGVWLGALQGRGRGVLDVREATDLWAAAEVHAAVAWSPVPRVALRVGAGGTVALRRPGFFLRDRPVLFRTPRFGGRVTVGVEMRFFGRGRTRTDPAGD